MSENTESADDLLGEGPVDDRESGIELEPAPAPAPADEEVVDVEGLRAATDQLRAAANTARYEADAAEAKLHDAERLLAESEREPTLAELNAYMRRIDGGAQDERVSLKSQLAAAGIRLKRSVVPPLFTPLSGKE